MLDDTGGEARTGLLLSPLLIEGLQVQVQLDEEALLPELMPELDMDDELCVAPKLKLSTIIGLEPLGQSVRLEHCGVAVHADFVVTVWARAGV